MSADTRTFTQYGKEIPWPSTTSDEKRVTSIPAEALGNAFHALFEVHLPAFRDRLGKALEKPYSDQQLENIRAAQERLEFLKPLLEYLMRNPKTLYYTAQNNTIYLPYTLRAQIGQHINQTIGTEVQALEILFGTGNEGRRVIVLEPVTIRNNTYLGSGIRPQDVATTSFHRSNIGFSLVQMSPEEIERNLALGKRMSPVILNTHRKKQPIEEQNPAPYGGIPSSEFDSLYTLLETMFEAVKEHDPVAREAYARSPLEEDDGEWDEADDWGSKRPRRDKNNTWRKRRK